MKTTTALMAAALLTSTVLVGCGATPSATEPPTRQQVPVRGLQPAAGWSAQPDAPAQMAPAGVTDAQAQQLLAGVRKAQTANRGFTATVQTWEKGAGKTEAGTLKIAFKKPSVMRLEIQKSTNTQAQGVKLRWEGGSEFKIKPTWMPFAVGVGITDKRVISLNGWTIKETDVTCILNVLLDPATQVKFLGPQTMEGLSLVAVEVRSPKSPKGVTHEVVGIDPQSGLPKARMLYKGQELVYKLSVKTMALKVPSESELSM
ncbi:MAG: hypothetical protein ACK46X_00150 [Candidatus Sericytochromatia bacterium]